MQSTMQLASQLEQIQHSFIEFSSYDPTTYYMGDRVLDRDEFKKLKKEGLIEVSFENNFGKKYTLSSKGKELINQA